MKIAKVSTGFRKRIIVVFTTTILLTGLVLPVLADNPGIGQTSSGQDLIIQIDTAVQNEILVPGQQIDITGIASIGALATQANVIYVVDVSDSTSYVFNQDCNDDGTVDIFDDFNGDNFVGDTLDCEISGVIALNDSLSSAPGVSAGLVLFGVVVKHQLI